MNAAKQELIKMSQQAKQYIKNKMHSAKTEAEALEAAALTVNIVLMAMHCEKYSSDVFKTAKQWKDEGFYIRKGEKANRIWGRPRKDKASVDMQDVKTKEIKTEESEYEFFPMVCLFNIEQVVSANTPDYDKPVKKDEVKTVDNAFTKATYQDDIEAKKDRLTERAEKKAAQSDEAYKRSHKQVEGIVFGQPILVGHHSEKRHRRDLQKSWDLMGKCVDLSKQAERLEQRAETVGTAGIASDDPEALKKLTAKLERLEKAQSMMKAENKKTPGKYAPYSLSNNGAEMRRVKKRIEDLKVMYQMEPLNIQTDDFNVFIDDGRIQIDFLGVKPDEETRAKVKDYGFKFSKHRYGCNWVRKVTPQAITTTKWLIKQLQTHPTT